MPCGEFVFWDDELSITYAGSFSGCSAKPDKSIQAYALNPNF